MDAQNRIYRAPEAEVPAADRARLEGALAASGETPEAASLREEVAKLKPQIEELQRQREADLRAAADWGFVGKTIKRIEDLENENRLILHFTDGTKGEVNSCSCCGLGGGLVTGEDKDGDPTFGPVAVTPGADYLAGEVTGPSAAG